MTDPTMADHVYLKPLNTKSIIEILKKHNIDAVLPTMGGQTALNLCIEAADKGIWDDFKVKIIGVDIDAIQITEDREQFRELMTEIGVAMAPQATANSYLKARKLLSNLVSSRNKSFIHARWSRGFFVHKAEDFDELLTRGLEISPIHEVMIDKALIGWKEYELELLRDKNDNVVIICTIENMDPMGIPQVIQSLLHRL